MSCECSNLFSFGCEHLLTFRQQLVPFRDNSDIWIYIHLLGFIMLVSCDDSYSFRNESLCIFFLTECSEECAVVLTNRSREEVWQSVWDPMNYLSFGFGFRATTGNNSMCWQVGGGTLEGHREREWRRYKGQTAAIHGSWERRVQSFSEPPFQTSERQKAACFAAPFESGWLWGQLTHTQGSQRGDTDTSAVCLRG